MRFEFVDEPFEVTAAEQNRNTIIMLNSLFGNIIKIQKKQICFNNEQSKIAGVDDES